MLPSVISEGMTLLLSSKAETYKLHKCIDLLINESEIDEETLICYMRYESANVDTLNLFIDKIKKKTDAVYQFYPSENTRNLQYHCFKNGFPVSQKVFTTILHFPEDIIIEIVNKYDLKFTEKELRYCVDMNLSSIVLNTYPVSEKLLKHACRVYPSKSCFDRTIVYLSSKYDGEFKHKVIEKARSSKYLSGWENGNPIFLNCF